MPPIQPKKKGTARMLELGYRQLQLWLSPTIAAALTNAAKTNDLPVARYAVEVITSHLAELAMTKKGE